MRANRAKDLQTTRQQAIELNELALKDVLTGIRNKAGFDREIQKIEWEIIEGLDKYGVAIIDMNYLNNINSVFGNDKGNYALILLSEIICKVFEHSPVFRIDNDEFAVILRGSDLENIDELVTEFQRRLNEFHKNPNLEYWQKISAAIGFAVYNPETDTSFDSVFERAEEAMYKNKSAMKESQNNA